MAKFTGSQGDDNFSGTSKNDKIDGRDGDDTLAGMDGEDKIKGGEGHDLIDGGGDDDDLKGGDGDDTVLGGDGDDKIKGDDGNDLLDGGNGADDLKGGDGNDTVLGGAGDDKLKGDKGDDSVEGGAGDDKIQGGAGNDTVMGGDGDDLIYGDGSGAGSGGGSGSGADQEGFDDYLDGGTGNDWIVGGQGEDTVLGGEGDDVLFGDAGASPGSGSGSDDGALGLWNAAQGSGSGKASGKGSGSGSGKASGKGSGSGSGDDEAGFDDYLDGGAGNDFIFAGGGDDEVHHNALENTGASDKYAGGDGIDKLTLELTSEEWFSAEVQADIANYLQFLADNTDPVSGEANSNTFQFTAFDLEVREFEELGIIVDGVELDPADAPADAIDDAATLDDEDGATAFGSVLDNDDVPDLVKEVRLISDVSQGVLVFNEGLSGAPDGSFSFDPNGEFDDLALGESRDVTFVYELEDANGDTDQATVTITVTGTNQAPSVSAPLASSAAEDDAAFDIDLLSGASDVDNGETATLSVQNVTGLVPGVTLSGSTLTVDPADAAFQHLGVGDSQEITVNFEVVDVHGASVAQSATITVNGVNDAPETTDDALDTDQNTAASINVLDNDSDIDGDGLTVTALTGTPFTGSTTVLVTSTGGRSGELTIWDNGDLSFDPQGNFDDLAAGETDSFSVNYTASDGNGGTSNGAVEVTITGANDAPVVSAIDAGTVLEDEAVQVIDLLAGQSDIDNGAVLSAVAITVTDDLGNTVVFTDNGNGTISIDPAQYEALLSGESRELTVNYEVSDGIDSTANTATLVVEGLSGNRAPTANDDDLGAAGTALTDENTSHTIAALDLLANDSDADGDTLTITSVSATSAQGATVTLNPDGSVEYDPTSSSNLDEMAQGETLTDSFTYTISDGNGNFDTATVTLIVSGVDDPPVLTGTTSAQAGFSDTDFSYQLPADLFTDHDEGGPITYEVTLADGSALPTWLVFDDATNTLSFAADAPQATDIGLYNLLVTATEDDGQSSTTAFTLSVLDGDLIEGTDAGETLYGTIQGDLMLGLGGNDYLYGLPGSDIMDGGDGDDRLYGEAGDDVLLGNNGNDYLYGEDGDDVLNGGAGYDNLNGGDGDDLMDGGEGGGTLNGGNGADTMIGGTGNDYFYAGYDSTADVMIGGDGNDVFSQGIGYRGSDVIDAGAGDDTISLNLYGYNAADPVNVDVTLGSGADTIKFDYTYNISQAQVTVSDFNTAEDTVDLNYMLNNQFSGWDGSTNPFADAALDPNGGFLQLVQVGSDVVLSVDMNGGGDNFSTLIVFENSLVGDFSADNFNPAYPPDGTVPAGILVDGTAASETLYGTIGADTLNGLDGNDYLWGGSSPDTLDGGNGNDQLHGEAGDDLVLGGDGNDYLYGEDGDDVLNGGAGYDNLNGGDGDDLMDGGEGGGTLNGGNGADTMIGGTGNDYFYAGYDSTADVMIGGDGNDVFSQGIGYRGSDVIDAGAGDDTISLNLYGYNAADPVNVDVTLGSGADTIKFDYTYNISQAQVTVSDFDTTEDTVDLNYMLNNQFSGWDGSTNPFADAALDPNGGFLQLVQVGSDVVLSVDMNGGGDNFSTLIVFENSLVGDFSADNFNPPYPPDGTVPAGILVDGTAASEALYGTIGADTINGHDGNDNLWGGSSPDTLDGGNGNDQLHGEAGDDLVLGGDGNDYLYGEDGDDVLNGGAGYDNLNGGNGDDLMDGGEGGGTLNGGNGADTMIGGTGNDVFYGGYDSTADVMTGGDGNDVFSQGIGYRGSDVIDAGAGDDTIHLNLYGYTAADPVNVDITLGSGADTIKFDYTYNLSYAQVTVNDFDTSEDMIDLDYMLNNQLSGWDGVSNPFGSGFMRLVQDGTDTVLEIDLNGNGDGFQTVMVFSNTDIDDFTDQNFLVDPVTSQGYNPDGSGVFGSTISGTASAESMAGTFGDDVLSGLGGADTIDGGNGADNLSGGTEADLLTGGFGNDTMSGGADADTFVFTLGGGDDVITDFSVGEDLLSLQSGLSISSMTDVDTNGDLANDALLVLLSDDSSVLLEGVTGITDPNDLLV